MVKADSTSIHSLAELKDSRVAGMKGSKQIDQVKVATGLSNVTGYDITYCSKPWYKIKSKSLSKMSRLPSKWF